MANPEHLAILKQGVKVWNEWRENSHWTQIDLSKANLTNAKLGKIDFSVLNLREADLSHAYLEEANLNGADLHKAILCESQLGAANLSGTELSEVNFTTAYLRGANFNGAHLNETDFTGAYMGFVSTLYSGVQFSTHYQTTFGDADLSKAKGLETVQHAGASTIGIDTIYRSKGNIPEVFLRGCGVPEDMIAYARSLRGKAFDFYSCFISHSAKDKHFCERLYADLQAKGVRVWYFPEDAKWGETVWGEIDHSIKVYDKLVVVLSENSLQSGPVNREIERALVREDKEGKGILFPIRIDDYIFDTWAHERKADVLRKVVGDFSGWDKDAAKYEKAFDKLLEGLQAKSGIG